ncbi:BAR-domain-containing protein [Amylocystis lapponica]|nr:BAR-domain-containing protein [Amylocystis lapponica]
MASKQLGKLRQWAGEVISSRDKTVVTDEFRELEHDIELRRQGLWRLHIVSEYFHHHLSKKKQSEALEEPEKLLPIDAMGVVMIKHGEEFGDDSAYGVSLVNFGRAHCRIATLQETFAMLLEDTYLSSIQRTEDEIREYQTQRKRLESRRLSYDAALSKLDKLKSSKKEKEKERKEAEDECARAQSRYEETAEDPAAELTGFLDLETDYVEKYLEVLRDVKAGWIDEATVKKLEMSRPRPSIPLYPHDLDESPLDSVRPKKSPAKKSQKGTDSGDDSSDDGVTRPRSKSVTSRKSDSGSKPPSRPQSRASRKRSDSTATATSEKEKADKAEKTRRISVAGWASSVSWRGKKDKDKDNFSTLRDGDDSDERNHEERPPSALSLSSHKSGHAKHKKSQSTPGSSPKASMRLGNSPYAAQRKVVVALHDFAAGSSDELTFRAGDKIGVVNEVLDGWWMGELKGKRGLFPTTYTEVISAPESSKPPLPQRPPAMIRGLAVSAPATVSLDDEGTQKSATADARKYGASDSEDDHPFSDHHFAASPMYGRFGRDDTSSSGDDDEELLMKTRAEDDLDDEWSSKQSSAWVRPPVRPRDIGGAHVLDIEHPPIPSRPATLHSKSSQSSSASLAAIATMPTVPVDDVDGLTNSPFDSPRDLSDCREFKQNMFKPKGWCSNCYQLHA